MGPFICIVFIKIFVWKCEGVNLEQQLQYIAEKHKNNQGIPNIMPSRRYYNFNPGKSSAILGAPSMLSHLPEAEPILPGHTLLRPSLDMLKSSVKFPHKDMDGGAGVYGNMNNLGISYDGRNERVLYSGFRRINDKPFLADAEPRKRQNSNNHRSLLVLLQGFQGDKYRKNITSNKRIQDKGNPSSELDQSVHKPSALADYIFVDLDTIKKRILRFKPFATPNILKDSASVILPSDEISLEYDNVHGDTTEVEDNVIQTPSKNNNIDPKLTWFWNSKDRFNHIKISPEVPEFHELVPVVKTDVAKNW